MIQADVWIAGLLCVA